MGGSDSAWEEERELERLQTGAMQAGGASRLEQRPSPDPQSSSSEEDDRPEYEVESLMAHRRYKGTLQYNVRWRGYGANEDTWEPASHLVGSSLLVSQYNAQHDIGALKDESEAEGNESEEAAHSSAGDDDDEGEEEEEEEEDDDDDDDDDDDEDDDGESNGDDDESSEEDEDDESGDSEEDDDDDTDEDDDDEHDDPGKNKTRSDESNAHAEALVGKWLSYLFYDTYAGLDNPVPRWYNCKVVSAGAPGKNKKKTTNYEKGKSARKWRDWVHVQFEDGEDMHLLVSPSREGEVWRRGKSRAKKPPTLKPRGTAPKRSRSTKAADTVERKLRRLMCQNPAADVEPQKKNGFHPVYNPSADPRKCKSSARVDWEQIAKEVDGEMSGRSLMRLWTDMQERETPHLETAIIAALGLHPLGDAKAAKGATLPLTCGETCIVHASRDMDDEAQLADAANANGMCASCLRQLLLRSGAAQTLCWTALQSRTPGKCLVCKHDVTKPYKPGQGRVTTKQRNRNRPVINGDTIEHQFQWQGTKWKWYSGQVQSRAQWGGWFNVEFEDGEILAVNLTRDNEGSVWRHHSTPSLVMLPSDPSATCIRAAIKAAEKAVETLTEQVAEEQRQRLVRSKTAAQLQEASASVQQNASVLYPQLAPDYSGNSVGYWTPAEDIKLVQCIARHSKGHWGWKETSSVVGHSMGSCRTRAELLGDLAAGVRTAIIRPGKEGSGIDTKRMTPADSVWDSGLDAKLRSAAAMRLVRENDVPGERGANVTIIQGWNEIAELVGRGTSCCRHRLCSWFSVSAAGTAKEQLVCKTCTGRYSTWRGFLLHNSHGKNRECASLRGYWMCKKCCRPFHQKGAFIAHEKTCKGPAPASTQLPISETEQKSTKSRRLESGKAVSSGTADADQQQAALRVVSTSFFSTEEVEKKMRKRTWQSSTTEEPRLKKWPTSRIPIAVRDTQTVKGFGAFASRAIQANEMLGEYAGEIIDAAELRKRQKSHDRSMVHQKPEPPPDMIKGMNAAAKAATVAGPAKRGRGESALTDEELAARMTGRHYVFDLGCGLSVDASHIGNSTRYLNHASASSHAANVRAQVTNHYGVRKVVFYAVRDIKASEELCYDYGEGFKRECGIELI